MNEEIIKNIKNNIKVLKNSKNKEINDEFVQNNSKILEKQKILFKEA